MIGFVSLDGGRTLVELWGFNEWWVTRDGEPDEQFARNLAVLRDVAEQFGGTFTFHPPDAVPPDAVS